MSGARNIDQEVSIRFKSATFLTGDMASYGRSDMARSAPYGLQSIDSKFLKTLGIDTL